MNDNFAGTPESTKTVGITPKSAQTSTATPIATVQDQLAEQLAELEQLNRSTYLPLPFYQKNKAIIRALQAILDIHSPFISGGKETDICNGCTQCWVCGEWGRQSDCGCDTYPCPTVQAITTTFATVAEVAGKGMRG